MPVNPSSIQPIANGLPLLTDGNWHLWDKRALNFFIAAGLRGIHVKLPNKPSEAEALKEWNDANDTLKPWLTLRVAEEYLYLVDDATTVEDAYKALKKHFERSTMGSRMAARKELYSVTHDPSFHITAFFHAVETARAKLSALGVNIDEKEMVDIILMQLDPSLHGARTALLTSKDEPDLQTVKNTLTGASSIETVTVKTEGVYMARSPRARATGSQLGISDSKGNTWCNTRSEGCHRCGRRSHQAYRCTTDMPPEVKNQILPSTMESAGAAYEDFDVEAFQSHPVWSGLEKAAAKKFAPLT